MVLRLLINQALRLCKKTQRAYAVLSLEEVDELLHDDLDIPGQHTHSDNTVSTTGGWGKVAGGWGNLGHALIEKLEKLTEA